MKLTVVVTLKNLAVCWELRMKPGTRHQIANAIEEGSRDNPQGRLATMPMVGEPSETLRSGLVMKLDPGWVTGFVDGEGCFHVGINAHADMAAGYQVLPEFTVVQQAREAQLLHALKAFFGCGVVR